LHPIHNLEYVAGRCPRAATRLRASRFALRRGALSALATTEAVPVFVK